MKEVFSRRVVTEKAGGFVSKIVFNNDVSIDIKKDDIVIFVGPNNSGKSQSLKDIYELCESIKPAVVVKNIEITKSSVDVKKFVEGYAQVEDHGVYKKYSGFGFGFTSIEFSDYNRDKCYGAMRPLFVTYLSTLDRLLTCEPADAIKRDAVKKHPIHYVAFESRHRKWLSDNYKKAFGKELIPHMQYGSIIPLCIGESVSLDDEYADEQERQEAYAKVLDCYEQVQNQGDGIKSFTGILLNLMIDNYCTYLIDEPESFLHPPQANIMGRIIGETLTENQQAFISTHSEEIIKGLLMVCPERIKVIRITRRSNENSFSILDNESFDEIWKDPLLRHSNIMQSLFHNTVVLCESDSDCKMYSAVETHLKQMEGKYSETLFIHCGGKHRMSKVAAALRSLGVNVKLIPDMDIMNDENVFKDIIETFGIAWNSIKKDYRIIVSNLHSTKERIKREEAKKDIMGVIDGKSSSDLSSNEIKAIRDVVSIISKWDAIKHSGKLGIPSGDASSAYQRIDKVLQGNNIYLVPVGEIEGFIKEVGGHGPDWVNSVLEKHPDMNDGVYETIKKFIQSLEL